MALSSWRLTRGKDIIYSREKKNYFFVHILKFIYIYIYIYSGH